MLTGAMKVIDVHAHFDPRLLDLPTMIAKLDRAGVDQVVLIPPMNDPLPKTPKLLLSVVRGLLCCGLRPIVRKISDASMTPEGDLKLGKDRVRIYPLPDNESIANVLWAHPDRFRGWIFLNPAAMEKPVEELERWRSVAGFIGVKLHPYWHRWPIEACLPIARRAEELELPILIHLGFGEHGRWQILTDACPKLKIVFAHAGFPYFDGSIWAAMRGRQNLYIDVSSPYVSERLVRRAIGVVGAEQALYGTDAPYGFPEPRGDGHSYDYGRIKGWIERLPSSSTEIERIFSENAGALIDRA